MLETVMGALVCWMAFVMAVWLTGGAVFVFWEIYKEHKRG